MRIQEIHIYGYGKMKDVSFTDIGNFQVFYGINEAGKSTIRSFIHSVLFGFPLKNQNDNRYEPKSHSAYGGKLVVSTAEHGNVSIQRIKGKAAGDVTVTFADGRIGGEEELKSLLQGLDKATYQSIYSFDLNGLTDLQKVSENEVSRYLLSAGMLGSGGLLQTEQNLQKEMDRLFKPSGKNPKLNVMLTDVKASFDRLSQASKEQDQYESLRSEYKQLLDDKARLEDEAEQLERSLTSSRNYQAAEPLLLEEKRIRNKINELDGASLPADASERYQQLKQVELPLATELKSLEQQHGLLVEQQSGSQVDKALWQEKERIQRAIDQTALLDSLHYDLQNFELQLQEKEKNIRQLKDSLHLHVDDEQILSLDTSSFKKERINLLEQKQQKLQHEKQYLDDKQESEQHVLQALEQRISQLKENILPVEQRQNLQKQVDDYTNYNQHAVELKYIERAIDAKEKQIIKVKRSEKAKEKNISLLVSAGVIGCLIVVLLFSLSQQWLLAGLFAGAGVMVVFLKKLLRSTLLLPDLQKELQELKHQQAELAGKSGLSHGDVEQARLLLRKDNDLQQQLHNEQIKKVEHEAAFHNIVDEFERWEKAIVQVRQASAEMLQEWNIPQQRTIAVTLTALYDQLAALKQHVYEKQQIAKKLQELGEKRKAIVEAVISYCHTFTGSITDSYQEAVLLMKRQIAQAEQDVQEMKRNKEALERLGQQLADTRFQINHIETELNALYREAQCEDEAGFLQAVRIDQERNAYIEKLELLQIQLEPYESERERWKRTGEIINDFSIRKLEEQKQMNQQQYHALTERLAEVKHILGNLEEGGTFDEKSFQYMTECSELNAEAREWMKYAVAKNMLQKAVNEYKNTKFPRILQTAEEYVMAITDGEYNRLQWKEQDDGLWLQRKDGTVFGADEVSRGTQEAVYVALRLSLAQASYTKETMPIIIDDSFVNFDRQRAENVIRLLQSLQQNRQIIFFTCHEYLLSYFTKASITKL